VQKSFALKLGWNPGRSDLYEDPEILKHFPHLARLKDVYRNARPRPAVPDYTLISDEISGPFSAVLSRDKSPSEGLHAAQQAIDRLEFRYGYRTNAAIP
jgi:multiple sugar transport system substrate-binding protein